MIHDLAHPWDEPGMPRHALMGAAAVRVLLGERVAALIKGHVPAKRYLVTVDPAYREQLSPGSVDTLIAQGGDLSAAEVTAFTARPHWRAAVALRRADDGAKVPDAVVAGLDHWLPILPRSRQLTPVPWGRHGHSSEAAASHAVPHVDHLAEVVVAVADRLPGDVERHGFSRPHPV